MTGWDSEMTVDLKKLTIFVAIVDEGSLTKAALRLHMTQPGVTVQLRKLEEMLSVTLFDRAKFQMGALTEHGERLLPIARRLLGHCSAIDQELAQLKQPVFP